jgi:hypothetical protein
MRNKNMANIKVQDLTIITGSDLFIDSESFLRDLSDLETNIQGGGTPLLRKSPVIVQGTPALIDPKNPFPAD